MVPFWAFFTSINLFLSTNYYRNTLNSVTLPVHVKVQTREKTRKNKTISIVGKV